jgi:hypothetical protein
MRSTAISSRVDDVINTSSADSKSSTDSAASRTGATDLRYGIVTSARSMGTNQFALKFMF